MSKFFATLLVATFVLAVPAKAQDSIEGPRSISADSIRITVNQIRLRVVGPDEEVQDAIQPTLEPPEGEEAQIWFTLGFMLDSCRVKEIERVDEESSGHPSMGSTLHNITFHCHYKASEFRSALRDMIR